MIRRTLLALALLAAPAFMVAQQPSPMQGQAPTTDTAKAKPAKKAGKHRMGKRTGRHAAKPAAKDTTKAKP
jgi:hypothetical protein